MRRCLGLPGPGLGTLGFLATCPTEIRGRERCLGAGPPPPPDRPAEGLQGLAPCFSTLQWEKPPPPER